jgi:hypothetical protein
LVYKSQIPVIERAIETAALMLGTDKSRGYCLEMICADFLVGAHLDNSNPEDPAQFDLPLLQVLARRTAAGLPREPACEGILRMIRPQAARLRLDPLSYESLRQQILRRDGWRCQSCGTMTHLEVHHREFRRGCFPALIAALRFAVLVFGHFL